MTDDQVLEKAFNLIASRFQDLEIAGLPGVFIEERELWIKLPAISAIYFLRSLSGTDDPETTASWKSQGILCPDWGPCPTVLYVGKAVNLRGRFHKSGVMGVDHLKLEQCLAMKDVWIHWLAIDKRYIAMVESVLIQVYQPEWNIHRS